MIFKVLTLFKVKTKQGDLTLNPGQVVTLAEEKATKLIEQGKLIPLPEESQDSTLTNLLSYFEGKGKIEDEFEAEALNERMAIMGENTEPEQVEPTVSDFDSLVVPFNSDGKYHYWNGGQSLCDTLKELGRCDLIEKYKSIYSK